MRKRKKEDVGMPLMDHIRELRKVLLVTAYAVAFGAIGGWIFSDSVFRYLATPVLGLDNVTFITTTPMEPILVKLKVSIIVGVILALPIIMWQLWSFILPALKQNERKYLYLIVPSSVLLFASGVAFCFYIVLPVGIKFLLFAGGGAVESTPFVTKTSYISFLLTLFLTFGIVFQLPVVLLLLIRVGILTPRVLAKHRKWAFFAIVVIAVMVSPTPDLFTQLLMAGPMYLLYEISIWLGYLVMRKQEKVSDS